MRLRHSPLAKYYGRLAADGDSKHDLHDLPARVVGPQEIHVFVTRLDGSLDGVDDGLDLRVHGTRRLRDPLTSTPPAPGPVPSIPFLPPVGQTGIHYWTGYPNQDSRRPRRVIYVRVRN